MGIVWSRFVDSYRNDLKRQNVLMVTTPNRIYPLHAANETGKACVYLYEESERGE